ncbi:MgtC/SapB family protein [Membranicola marinus]|uniref:MgtC/SapB family protein n=1 Tax=Membranihabitans marinus TaxID=1227546 RepID=A0A953LEB3_9BACT|nr:MgtC/SapB family protein [Membranihabitans marinus]MBY5959759.1 MgtC/SapB family protein [Membranihabitans marinus]
MEETIQELASYDQQWLILLDILIAMVLGGLIGIERELKGKPAGFRTNMIIAGAATLFIEVGRIGVLYFGMALDAELIRADPVRILHAVIVGVGFIGAGTIIKSERGEEVHYLTTAATIWMSAAIGIAVALHLYVLALSVTVVLLIINSLFHRFENWVLRKNGKETDN